MIVARCRSTDQDDWLRMRQALWPTTTTKRHRTEMAALLERGGASYLAHGDDGAVVGFAEASLRRGHVNGCETSPVGFLEGIYVDPAWRRRGVAVRLVRAVCAWAADLGCSELASDIGLDNKPARDMHAALGFAETERVVFFRRPLA